MHGGVMGDPHRRESGRGASEVGRLQATMTIRY